MFRQFITHACQKQGINLQILSHGWLYRLEKSGQIRYIFNDRFSLNSQSASAIAADKFATFEVLNAAGLPIIEHALFYNFDDHRPFAEGFNTPEYLQQFFNAHKRDIVIKPNSGSGGRGISHVTSPEQFSGAITAAFQCASSASLCPFYSIRHEYRIIMLDGAPRLFYGKKRGADWRFNLQNGATAVEITDPALQQRLIDLAKQTVQVLGLRFCSVDIIETDTVKPDLMVIEVNSAVCTRHYREQHPDKTNLIEAIYNDAVAKMFEPRQ